ncbi:MAG: TraR/DksA C4-type zinc finger protein [Phycisphaeraceae bacterium]|nr:TraR/DksA C4-type zinc finger protein [Phycisphaeraceae bacterium]
MAKKKTSSKAGGAGSAPKRTAPRPASAAKTKPAKGSAGSKGSSSGPSTAKKPAKAGKVAAPTASGKSPSPAKSRTPASARTVKSASTKGSTKVSVKSATPANGQKVAEISDRVARIRATLRRSSEATSRFTLPNEPITEAQLRKVKTGLSKADLDHYRLSLLQKRAEILGDVEALSSDTRNGGGNISYEHMADTGTDNYEQEFNLELVESERALLQKINEALIRLRNGTYGVCYETGKPIGKTRLDAKPWAKYCIEVARELERQGKDV